MPALPSALISSVSDASVTVLRAVRAAVRVMIASSTVATATCRAPRMTRVATSIPEAVRGAKDTSRDPERGDRPDEPRGPGQHPLQESEQRPASQGGGERGDHDRSKTDFQSFPPGRPTGDGQPVPQLRDGDHPQCCGHANGSDHTPDSVAAVHAAADAGSTTPCRNTSTSVSTRVSAPPCRLTASGRRYSGVRSEWCGSAAYQRHQYLRGE